MLGCDVYEGVRVYLSVQSLSVQESDGLGKKLFRSLVVRARMLRYLFLEGSRVKSVCKGCVGSSTMLVALRMQRVR